MQKFFFEHYTFKLNKKNADTQRPEKEKTEKKLKPETHALARLLPLKTSLTS